MREGLVKHDTDYDVTDAAGYEPELAGTLECQISNLADEIAYNTADLEDGLRSGVLDFLEVRELGVWQSTMAALGERSDCRLDDKLRARVIRRLIGIEISDAINATAAALAGRGIASVDEVRAAGENVACFSDEIQELNLELKAFLMKNFYRHPRVVRMAYKANHMLTDLFNAYLDEPRQLPREIQARMSAGPDGPHRVICDYIAGMTDRFAILEHKRLFDPEARV